MTGAIVLDSGPLGLVTNPRGGMDAIACKAWLQDHLDRGSRVIIPGIADYEVRRELIRANKQAGLHRLEEFRTSLEFLPVNQRDQWRAAELWAQVRALGAPSAHEHALDADCILAAQVILLAEPGAIIAALNVAHLSRFTDAAHWQDIL